VTEEFVGEQIKPVPGAVHTLGMTRREPGLPRFFTWRGERCEVAQVLDRWKETGPCTSGSGEQYLRKHWFRVRTTSGQDMKLYFERQARRGSPQKSRWWLYSVAPAAEARAETEGKPHP
jgi:hypothetical protein